MPRARRGTPSLVLFLLAVMMLATVGTAPAQAPPPTDEPEYAFEAGHSTPLIPIELASNKVHVQLSMDGGEPVWFLLDSGANVSVLNREYAEALGLALRNESTADDAAGGRSFWFAFTNAPPYSFPGVAVKGHPFAVLERRTQPSNGHDSLGLLGANHFRRFVVDVDYPGRTIRFHDPAHFEYDGPGAAIPVEIDENGKALMEVEITPYGGEPIADRVSVDTGGRGLLTLNAPFVEEKGLIEKLPRSVLATVGLGIGGPVTHHVGRLAELRFGPISIRDVPATFAPKGTKGAYGKGGKAGVLDAELLTRFRVIFDYARNRLIFEPREDLGTPFEVDMSGTFLTADGPAYDSPRVMSVLDGSPASAAGLIADDLITAIDGVPAARYSLDEIRALLKTDGSVRRLTVRRGERTLDLEIRLRRLI